MPKRASLNTLTRDTVLDFMRRADYAPMTAPELATALTLRGGGSKALARLLHQMVIAGEIVLIRKVRYSLGAPADLVTGRVEFRRSGDGYLAATETTPAVRIDKINLETCLPGDVVTVRLEPAHPDGEEPFRMGKVIRIVERAKRVVVGTLRSTGRFFYVVPLDPAYQQDFYVPDAQGAQLSDRVVIQFTNWENRHVNPEAEIIEVIGPADNPSLDTLSIMRQYELPEGFPEEVMREAERSAGRMTAPGKRLDLRGSFIFTVDPATAKDFDDALSLDRDPQGRRVLGVHIADVSHFVMRGSVLDAEAQQRGNSVYLPDKVVPMLPEELSNGLCSLKPGQDRLAFSVFITFDDEGRPVSSRFGKSIICSRLRLTYEEALKVIETPAGMKCREGNVAPETVALIREICDLAMQMRARRFAQYALDLDMPENQVVIGPDGTIIDIRPVVNDVSHQMIEECMVAANEAVAQELTGRGLRIVHRLHESPSEERIDDLSVELRGMGYQPGNLKQRRNLSEFLKRIRTTPLAHCAQTAVLRSMKRAVYSAEKGGHFGLAKTHYSHFTSPIRRYPDLIVHRILQAVLEGRPSPYGMDELKRLALNCSDTEQNAAEAERDLVEIKKYRWLEQQLKTREARVYDAVVVRVMNFGLFVELEMLDIQGLVHISTLSDSFVHFDPGMHQLRAGREMYSLGAHVKVRVARVDFDKRRIDFVLDGVTPGQAKPQGGGGRPGAPAPGPTAGRPKQDNRSRQGSGPVRSGGSQGRTGHGPQPQPGQGQGRGGGRGRSRRGSQGR
jgi:ribonuclease R